MKKKIIALMLIIGILAGTLSGCGKNSETENELVPEEAKMKDICQLVTQEFVLSTVAKNVKIPDKGWMNIFDQDREVWIQYEGKVPVGVEFPENFCEIKGTKIKLKEPKAIVKDPDVLEETFTKESFFISEEKWYSSNEVTAEFQKELLAAAQKELKASVEKNPELLHMAEKRAKDLIENYISQIEKYSGKDYTIEWIASK